MINAQYSKDGSNASKYSAVMLNSTKSHSNKHAK